MRVRVCREDDNNLVVKSQVFVDGAYSQEQLSKVCQIFFLSGGNQHQELDPGRPQHTYTPAAF